MGDMEAHGFVPVAGTVNTEEVPDIPDALPPDIDTNGHIEGSSGQDVWTEGRTSAADEMDSENDTSHQDAVLETALPAVIEKVTAAKPERLYFVRLPKPDLGDEDIALEKVKAEFNSMKAGSDLLLATLKVERVKQDEAKREFEAADQVFQESRVAQEQWREQLEPLRNASRVVTDQRNQMRDNARDLPARTEQELDKMIEDIEFSLNHETLSVHEERKLIAQIKKLDQSRPRVRTVQAAMMQLEQSREDLDDFKQHKEELERKLDMIRAEVQEAWEIKQARYGVLKGMRARTNQLADELTAMRASKDEKWEELNRLRDVRKLKLDQYYDNRRFSQTVRQLLAKGPEGILEAKQQCADVNDRLVEQITGDSEFRSEYTRLWDLQRKYSVTLADIALDTAPAKKPATKKPTNGLAASGKARAQDIISTLMAEADAELGKATPSGPAASTAASKSIMAPSNGHAGPSHTTEGLGDIKPKPMPKPRADKAKAPVTREVNVDDAFEPFVPPPRSPPEAKPSPEQQKRAIREEQRAKAAEAEERKRKREEAKARKAHKANEMAKMKEEEEELRAELEKERIRREADEQRRRDAKRKEDAKRKAAAPKGNAKGKHGAQARDVVAVRPAKLKAKPTLLNQAKKFGKEHQTVLISTAVVVSLAVALGLLSQVGA